MTLRQKLAMNIKALANNTSYPKAAAIVIAIASTITLGYGMKKHLPGAIDAVQEYQRYTQECRVFLERVGTAGTIGVAEPELVKVVSFLKTNHLAQSFEYKDLQANLAYLKSQPDNSLMPGAIKESISKNTVAIEEAQTKKLNQDLKSLFSLEIAGSVMALAIAALIIKEENDN
ncbi:hypothetical protein [Aliterella atlantica]|nr:hypothetical protein [Aliterella atlantica]